VIGWLLDTNVLAELARGDAANARVAAWASGQNPRSLWISILTIAEYEQGAAKLAVGDERRRRIAATILATHADYADRVLSLSDPIVRLWGKLSGEVKRATRHAPPVIDTMLAATAIEKRLYLATRNVRDVRATGAAVFNPWTDDPARFPLSG
jgi:predicted nucleic acid-binding protein